MSERRNWPLVPLGDVLTPVARAEVVSASGVYRLLGVRLDNNGAFLRETVDGGSTAAKTLYKVDTNDFVYSRLFAWRGAFAIIPSDLAGCYVSSEFPTYRAIAGKCIPAFLRYWFCLPTTLARVGEKCTGSTPLTRNRFKESFFERMEIPLPPLAEQERIVAKLDAVAAKVDEARRQIHATVAECDALLRSLVFGRIDGREMTPMHQLVSLRETGVAVEQDGEYRFAGVYCFGRGVFRGHVKRGLDFAYERLTQLHVNDFVYPKLMAWEGAMAVVPPECDGLFVSPEFPVFEVDQAKVLPEFLDVYFRTPAVWPALSGASTGTNVRRRRLKPADFLKHHIPLLSMRLQIRLREIKRRVDAVKLQQASITEALDALMPAALDQAFAANL